MRVDLAGVFPSRTRVLSQQHGTFPLQPHWWARASFGSPARVTEERHGARLIRTFPLSAQERELAGCRRISCCVTTCPVRRGRPNNVSHCSLTICTTCVRGGTWQGELSWTWATHLQAVLHSSLKASNATPWPLARNRATENSMCLSANTGFWYCPENVKFSHLVSDPSSSLVLHNKEFHRQTALQGIFYICFKFTYHLF